MADGPIVCDTGPLIALSLIDQLDLLRGLYRGVVVPRTVLDEVTAGGADRPGAAAIVAADWLEPVDDLTPDPLLAGELGPGEAAVIAAAYKLQARLVLLDERKARRIAVQARPVARGRPIDASWSAENFNERRHLSRLGALVGAARLLPADRRPC